MKHVANLIARTGDYLLSLSDRTRKRLVLFALLLLGMASSHKLVTSLIRLGEPQPVATPEQLLKPMEKLFDQTNRDVGRYRQSHRKGLEQLDSLANERTTRQSSDL